MNAARHEHVRTWKMIADGCRARTAVLVVGTCHSNNIQHLLSPGLWVHGKRVSKQSETLCAYVNR